MSTIIEKVTAFITRPSADGPELLLFEHPYAGIQIPAGTVGMGEAPEAAALREAREETGLTALAIVRHLGLAEEQLPAGERIIAASTRVYSRPDVTSSDWAYLRPGLTVRLLRQAPGFAQVSYEEFDRIPDPTYVTLTITGWVPDGVLAAIRRRYFFHLEFRGESPRRWTLYTDRHHFTLFWAPVTALPPIISPQDAWLQWLF